MFYCVYKHGQLSACAGDFVEFLFFFLLKFKTPVTLGSGELPSILVVRLAHLADLHEVSA